MKLESEGERGRSDRDWEGGKDHAIHGGTQVSLPLSSSLHFHFPFSVFPRTFSKSLPVFLTSDSSLFQFRRIEQTALLLNDPGGEGSEAKGKERGGQFIRCGNVKLRWSEFFFPPFYRVDVVAFQMDYIPFPSHSTDSSFSHSVPDLVFKSEEEEDYSQDCRGEGAKCH